MVIFIEMYLMYLTGNKNEKFKTAEDLTAL